MIENPEIAVGSTTEEGICGEIAIAPFLSGNTVDPVALSVAIDVTADKRGVTTILACQGPTVGVEGDDRVLYRRESIVTAYPASARSPWSRVAIESAMADGGGAVPDIHSSASLGTGIVCDYAVGEGHVGKIAEHAAGIILLAAVDHGEAFDLGGVVAIHAPDYIMLNNVRGIDGDTTGLAGFAAERDAGLHLQRILVVGSAFHQHGVTGVS
jgi:hypothetical protein